MPYVVCKHNKKPNACVDCLTETMIDAGLVNRDEANRLSAPTFATKYAEALLDANYKELHRILVLAFMQSARGKGNERHNPKSVSFDQQQIVAELLTLGSAQYAIGQANKKMHEALHLSPQRAIHDWLGAIVYLVAAIRFTELTCGNELVENESYVKELK
jgi:hypothetical protein